MKRTIRRDITYPHPVEKVWRALTDKDVLSRWFMKTDFEPVVGQSFTFKTEPAPGFDGVVSGEVLSADAPYHLAYTWRGGPLEETVVQFWLEPQGRTTRVRLEHSGFSGVEEMVPSLVLQFGWRKLLQKDLLVYLATQEVASKGEKR